MTLLSRIKNAPLYLDLRDCYMPRFCLLLIVWMLMWFCVWLTIQPLAYIAWDGIENGLSTDCPIPRLNTYLACAFIIQNGVWIIRRLNYEH